MVFKALFIHMDDDHNSLLKQNFSASLFLLVIVTACSFLSALEHFTMPVLTQVFLNHAVSKLLKLKIIFQIRGVFKGRQKTEEVIVKSKDERKLTQLGHRREMYFSIILPVYHKLEVCSKHCNRVSIVGHLQWLCSYCVHDSLFPHIKAKVQILNY